MNMSDAAAPDRTDRIEYLAERHSRGELSPADISELNALCVDPLNARQFVEALADRHEWRRWASQIAPNENFARVVLERHAHGPASSRFLNAVTSVAKSEFPDESPRGKKSTARSARSWSAKSRAASRSRMLPAWIAAVVILGIGLYALLHSQKTPPLSIATLSRVRDASVTRDGNALAVTKGMDLFAADEIRVAAGGSATISFADQTSVDAGAGATVMLDPPLHSAKSPDASGGKNVFVASGAVTARVAPQPAGRPMIFSSAIAEATVVGTELQFSVAEKSARLDVTQGRVTLKRLDDGASVDVAAGNFCVASRELALVAQAIAPVAPPVEPGVFYVAENGVDTHEGSREHPCREIKALLSMLKPGNTIRVADGLYHGFEITDLRGTPEKPITIQAVGRAARILPADSQSDALVIDNARYLVIDGFQISDARRNGINIHYSQFVTIRNCRVGGSGLNGIAGSFCDDLHLEQNESFGNKTNGISVSNSSHRPLVRANHLYNNGESGIFLNGDRKMRGGNGILNDGLVTGALVENNRIHANNPAVGAAINMDGVQDSVLRNNLLYDNHSTGIALYKTDGAGGPKNLRLIHNTIEVAADARFALEIHGTAGPVILRNNIIFNRNGKYGSLSFGSSKDFKQVDSDYNLFGGATEITPDDGKSRLTFEAWQAQGRDQHSLISTSAESLFVRPTDFHLKENSLARSIGEILPDSTNDIEGHARPADRRPDIGAYQD